MTDWTLTIGAITMGPGTDYIVTEVDGFGIPDVRNGDTDRPIDVGGYFGRDFIGSRTVTISVACVGDNLSDAIDAHDALMTEWYLTTPDSTTIKPLTVQRPGRAAQRWNGRPRRAASSPIGGDGVIAVVLEYACADPRIYDDAQSSGSASLPTVGGGRAYPLTFPRVYGTQSTGGFVIATNAGNFPTRPVVTITGPCNSPSVSNDTTGDTLKTTLVLTSTDTVVIDFDQRTVTFNGSQTWSLTSDSVWWELLPGDNQIRFSAAAYVLGASMSITWRSARIG